MPALRRRRGGEAEGFAPPVPWALGELLRLGPAPLAGRPVSNPERLDVVIVLGPGQRAPRDAGLPAEMLEALQAEGVGLRVAGEDDAGLAGADVVLAAGWPAAPAVLRAPDLRARAVLATSAPAPFAERGWTAGIDLLGPAWLGGALPGGADAVYAPLPVHRREDLVLVHGDEPLGLLAAAELHRRRDGLAFAVSGARQDLELPFPFLGVAPGGGALAHAFASAAVALAPPVRGWRPAAVAMLVCGQAVVAPDDAPTRAALGESASFAADPLAAADAVEALLDDLALRAERARTGFAQVPAGWSATAAALAAALRALP